MLFMWRAEEHHRKFGLLGAWQAEEERRADTEFALHPDAPTVRLDDGAADVEAEARARRPAAGGGIELLESLEDALPLAQWDALPGVGHADDHLIIRHLAAHADVLAARRVF